MQRLKYNLKQKSLCFIVYIFLSVTIPASAFDRVATTSFQFLKLPVGVRGIGMGNAFVAGARDASAIYWNPAGLGWTKRYEVLLAHINLPADIRYDNIAIILPFSKRIGTFGMSIGVVSMDDILVRTVERPEGTGEFVTASDIALTLSYARQINDRFTFGISGKYIREDLADFIATGVSFDAGLQYQTNFRSLRLGMVIQNFGPDTKFNGSFQDFRGVFGTTNQPEQRNFETTPIPLTFKVGFIADIENMLGINIGKELKGNLAGQFEHPSDNGERFNAGIEFVVKKKLAIRTGYNINYDTDRFAFGFGIKIPIDINRNMSIDYAYADQGDLTDTSTFLNQPHRFSLSLQF